MKWYLKAFKQYADFSGRARRTEYWMFVLFNFLFAIVAMALDFALGLVAEMGFGPIYLVYLLASLIPGLALSVRRLHDTGKSGWMFLINLIPFIGGIWYLVLMVSSGDQGKNQYGENPVEENPSAALA